MSRRFPPERPASFQVEGHFHDRSGATYEVKGRLTVTADNEANIEGRANTATTGEFAAPTRGNFQGRLDDETEVELPVAHLDRMDIRWGHIGSGWSTRLSALGHVDFVSQRAANEDALDVYVTVWWTLSHSSLLWHAAKRFFTYESDRMSAAGISAEALQREIGARPNPCTWDIKGRQFEIGWFEEICTASADVASYPVRATRFVPRARASTRFRGTGAELRAEFERIGTVLEGLLSCIGFLQAGRVHWYERTEEGCRDNPAPPPTRTFVHKVARLLIGRIPEAARDSVRARLWAKEFVTHAPTLVGRFAEGEPFTSAALDAYLLAGEAEHWPSRLLLLSTALESLKELFLRSQDQRGVLANDHWSELLAALECKLGQSWREAFGPKDVRGLIKSKMRELNRPSYRRTLEAMVAGWGVPIDDLPDPFAFIKLRDALVHTGQVPDGDYEVLAQATGTVSALFERLMAAWLEVPIAGSTTLGTP